MDIFNTGPPHNAATIKASDLLERLSYAQRLKDYDEEAQIDAQMLPHGRPCSACAEAELLDTPPSFTAQTQLPQFEQPFDQQLMRPISPGSIDVSSSNSASVMIDQGAHPASDALQWRMHRPPLRKTASSPVSNSVESGDVSSGAERLIRQPSALDRVPVIPFNARSSEPLLLLDTRPAHIFQGCQESSQQAAFDTDHGSVCTGHLRNAINVQIPSLLLRRTQRALTSSPALLDSIDIASYIHSEAGHRKFCTLCSTQHARAAAYEGKLSPSAIHELVRAFWFIDIVVLYEDEASSFAAHLLVRMIFAIRSRAVMSAGVPHDLQQHGVYYVSGGMRQLREDPAWLPLFEVGDTQVDESDKGAADVAESPQPFTLDAPPAGQRKPALPRLNTSMQMPASAVAPSMPTPWRMPSVDGSMRLPLTASLHVVTDHKTPLMDEPRTACEIGDIVEFEVSTIVPNELYLGSQVQTPEDAEKVERLGVRAILNTAMEVLPYAATSSTPTVLHNTHIVEYMHLPMRDVVEAVGVQQHLREACRFLETMRARGLPTFVHCRAGKSRSATCVMAYLIKSRSWTLKQAYAYVAAKRPQTSPNIGFIAELMHFERATLGTGPRVPCLASSPQHTQPGADGEAGHHTPDVTSRCTPSVQ